MFIVKLTDNYWLAGWQGDPPQTLVMNSARVFDSVPQAERALKKVRKLPYRNGYPDAQILGVHLALNKVEDE